MKQVIFQGYFYEVTTMANIHIKESDITYDYLSYPFGSFGNMLLIRANLPGDMSIGDFLYFDGEALLTNKVITVNTSASITASHPVPGSDPVEYTHSKHGINLSSFTDPNLQKVDEVSSKGRYAFYPVGETYLRHEKASYVQIVPPDIAPEAGDGGLYYPLVGWLALYSTKLNRYINYCSFNSGNYPASLHKYPDEVVNEGLVYGDSPYSSVSGSVFGQSSNPSGTRCGIGQIWVFPYQILDAEWGRYGQGVVSEESVISKIFANRDPIDIDPDDPGDNSKPYGDKAGATDGSKPIIGNTGDGDYDYSYTPVPIPELPDSQTAVTGSGFINIYHPTKTQIKNLGKFMFSKFLSLETIAKAFSNPMDYIQAILMLPIPSDKMPDGDTSRVYVANKDTGLDWKELTSQWIVMNCGTLTLKEPTKTYLDYGPYTKLSVYLPYIGIVDVDIDDFLDRRLSKHTITVSYHIDLMTGSFLCYVSRGDGAVMYTYSGSCASQLPISQASYQSVYTSVIQMGLSLATGGAYRMLGKEVTNKAGRTYNTTANQQLQSTMDAGSSAADAVMSAKPDIVRTSNIQGSTGLLSIMYPYLIYSHPYGVWPDSVNGISRFSLTGLPSGQLIKIASLKGFTQIEAINLQVDGALADEVAEIERTLRDGVII